MRVRYAVVGLGHIAQAAVLPAFAHAGVNSQLAALLSDDQTKRKELALRYGVPAFPYEDLDTLLRSRTIDAVYIALPNHLHRDYTLRAAKAGIHVLCEKPLAVHEKDCREMIAAAKKGKIKLMTAYRLHFEASNLAAITVAGSGQIGDLRLFNSVFSMEVGVTPDNIRLRSEAGGGPVYDLGVYCINAARYLFRDEPTEVYATASSRADRRFREIDEMVAVTLRFPGERLATFTCSFGAASSAWFQLVGTKGDVRLNQAYDYTQDHEMILTVGDKTETRYYPRRDQFAPELIYFSKCILAGREPEPSGLEGLADVRVIDAIHKSVQTGRPVKLPRLTKSRRPTAAMEIYRPFPDKPGLIHVEASH